MNNQEADKLLEFMKKNDDQLFDFDSMYEAPFFDAVGDDKEGMLKYLESLPLEDLDWVSGMFCDIYDKWHDRKTKKRLDKMANKLMKNGYLFSW